MLCDVAIPTLPSSDINKTIAFYQKLGFQVISDADYQDYVLIHRDLFELHFFLSPEHKPAESYAGSYLRVSQVDELFWEFESLNLPTEGIPRIATQVEDKPWGMREFHIIDPDGNSLRIGQRMV